MKRILNNKKAQTNDLRISLKHRCAYCYYLFIKKID